MNGIGTSGIVVSELSFSVPRTAYAESTVSDMAPAVTFTVTGSGVTVTAPTFYVDCRTPSGGVIDFVCYDRLAFADGITLTETTPRPARTRSPTQHLRRRECSRYAPGS